MVKLLLTQKWKLVLFLFVSVRASANYAPVTCPEVSIKGSDCKSLVVEMGLSECPEGQDFKAMKVTSCDDTSATARLWTDEAIYKVNLSGKKDAKGTIGWKVTETTRQINKTKTEAKSSTTVTVAVTPDAAKPAAVPVAMPAAVPAAPPAPLPWVDRISFGGHVRLKTERSDFTDYNSIRNPTYLRIRPTITIKANPEIDVVFEPQFARTFGEQSLTSNGTAASAGSTKVTQSGATADPGLSMHQGYLTYRPAAWMSFLLGRQTLAYGDELVLGALEWNNVGRAFDAIKSRITYGWGSTDLFASKLVYNDAGTKTGSGDMNLFGLYNNFKLGTYVNNLDLYMFYRDDKNTAPTSPVRLTTVGMRIASAFHGFDYRVEGTGQSRNPNINRAYQIDGEIGYTIDTAIKPRLGLHYFHAGANYDQLYPTGHAWLGYADIFGRRNISGVAAHLTSNFLSNKLTVRLDYHYFRRASADTTAFKLSGLALGTTGSDSLDLGSEYDLTVSYKLSNGLTLMGGVSIFDQGTYLEEEFNHKAPSFAFLQIMSKF